MKKLLVFALVSALAVSSLSFAQAAKRKRKAKPKAPVATAPGPADTTQAKAKPSPLSNILPEQEVKGTYKGKIEEDKPVTAPKFDIYGVVDAYAGSGYIYDKDLLVRSDIATTPPPSLSSTQLRSPWLRTILKGRIAIFHPQYGQSVERWELVISTPRGEVFRRFEGKGSPPKQLDWDGRGDNGAILDVGATYSYSAFAWDKAGNKSQVVGQPLRISGLLYHEGGTWVIAVRGDDIFPAGKAALYEGGLSLLQEATDLTREKFSDHVSVRVYSDQDALSLDRARMVASYLNQNLILPQKALSFAAGYVPAGVYKSNRLDILVQ
jgi:hypothetical protein